MPVSADTADCALGFVSALSRAIKSSAKAYSLYMYVERNDAFSETAQSIPAELLDIVNRTSALIATDNTDLNTKLTAALKACSETKQHLKTLDPKLPETPHASRRVRALVKETLGMLIQVQEQSKCLDAAPYSTGNASVRLVAAKTRQKSTEGLDDYGILQMVVSKLDGESLRHSALKPALDNLLNDVKIGRSLQHRLGRRHDQRTDLLPVDTISPENEAALAELTTNECNQFSLIESGGNETPILWHGPTRWGRSILHNPTLDMDRLDLTVSNTFVFQPLQFTGKYAFHNHIGVSVTHSGKLDTHELIVRGTHGLSVGKRVFLKNNSLFTNGTLSGSTVDTERYWRGFTYDPKEYQPLQPSVLPDSIESVMWRWRHGSGTRRVKVPTHIGPVVTRDAWNREWLSSCDNEGGLRPLQHIVTKRPILSPFTVTLSPFDIMAIAAMHTLPAARTCTDANSVYELDAIANMKTAMNHIPGGVFFVADRQVIETTSSKYDAEYLRTPAIAGMDLFPDRLRQRLDAFIQCIARTTPKIKVRDTSFRISQYAREIIEGLPVDTHTDTKARWLALLYHAPAVHFKAFIGDEAQKERANRVKWTGLSPYDIPQGIPKTNNRQGVNATQLPKLSMFPQIIQGDKTAEIKLTGTVPQSRYHFAVYQHLLRLRALLMSVHDTDYHPRRKAHQLLSQLNHIKLFEQVQPMAVNSPILHSAVPDFDGSTASRAYDQFSAVGIAIKVETDRIKSESVRKSHPGLSAKALTHLDAAAALAELTLSAVSIDIATALTSHIIEYTSALRRIGYVNGWNTLDKTQGNLTKLAVALRSLRPESHAGIFYLRQSRASAWAAASLLRKNDTEAYTQMQNIAIAFDKIITMDTSLTKAGLLLHQTRLVVEALRVGLTKSVQVPTSRSLRRLRMTATTSPTFVSNAIPFARCTDEALRLPTLRHTGITQADYDDRVGSLAGYLTSLTHAQQTLEREDPRRDNRTPWSAPLVPEGAVAERAKNAVDRKPLPRYPNTTDAITQLRDELVKELAIVTTYFGWAEFSDKTPVSALTNFINDKSNMGVAHTDHVKLVVSQTEGPGARFSLAAHFSSSRDF